MARENLIAFQSRKLRRVIAHAYANVAYWRGLFDRAGLKPQDIREAEDLAAIPVATRQDLNSAGRAALLTQGLAPRGLVVHSTTGSSGRPFRFCRGEWEEHLLNQFRIRARRQQGVRWRDRVAIVRLTPVGGSRLSRLRKALGIRLSHLVDCRQEPEAILTQLDRLRPDVIIGYPATLTHLAPLLDRGRWPGIRPRLMATGGETLIPAMRRRIEEAFGARVFDAYGAHEANLLAWECPQTGLYHVCDDNVIVEILRDGRPAAQGQRGLVVATALHAYAMPFLRLRMDDVATRGPTPCPCGQPFSTLRAIEGRMHDYFPLPDGRCPHPYDAVIDLAPSDADWIGQYQVIQERMDRIVFRVSPLRAPSAKDLERVRRAADKHFGPTVDFRIEIVDRIAFEPGGKFRVSHSMVASPYEGAEFEGG